MDWKSGEREGRGGLNRPRAGKKEGPLPAFMMDLNGETRTVGIGGAFPVKGNEFVPVTLGQLRVGWVWSTFSVPGLATIRPTSQSSVGSSKP